MLSVTLHADRAGCLRRLVVRGHAPDIACAAITALTRTAATLLAAQPALECRGTALRPGVLELHVGAVPAQHRDCGPECWSCTSVRCRRSTVTGYAASVPWSNMACTQWRPSIRRVSE